MLDLNQVANEQTANTSTRKKADAWFNPYIGLKGDKKKQVGEYGIPLYRDEPLGKLLIDLAENKPEAIEKLKIFARINIVDTEAPTEIELDLDDLV